MAEESLALCKTLDPAAAEIWKIYYTLAAIAEQQGDAAAAAGYRRQERAAYAGFAGSRHALRKHGPLIAAVVRTVERPEHRAELEQVLEAWSEKGWGNLIGAIRRVLDGERDEEALSEPLNREEALIVRTILEGIRDPGSIRDLVEPEEDQGQTAGSPEGDVQARLARHAHLILAVLAATGQPLMREQLERPLRGMTEQGWGDLVAAIERLLAGERDPDALCAGLDAEDTLIVRAVLAGIENPEVLASLLPTGGRSDNDE